MGDHDQTGRLVAATEAAAALPEAHAGGPLDVPGALLPSPGRPRSHLDLADENEGFAPWCGPAALALATGRGYGEAGDLLRGIAPGWYPESGPIVTAYWRDLLAGLEAEGIPFAPVALPERRPSLLRLVRAGGLEPGWYMVRVTDHFLLLRSHGFGLAQLHDNRHTGVLVTGRTHGRRKVTHLARLLGGPLLAATGSLVAAATLS